MLKLNDIGSTDLHRVALYEGINLNADAPTCISALIVEINSVGWSLEDSVTIFTPSRDGIDIGVVNACGYIIEAVNK